MDDIDRELRELACHVRHFLREFSFIKELHPVVQDVLSDIVVHARCKAEQILYTEGEEPTEVFVILSGEVHVFKKDPVVLDDGKHAPVKTLEGGKLSRRHAHSVLKLLDENHIRPQTRDSTPPDKILPSRTTADIPVNGVHVYTLRPGCMLGETGILTDKPHETTSVCSADSELLVIRKEDLKYLIKVEMNKLRFKQLAVPVRQLLRDFSFYKDIEPEAQSHVLEILQHERFKAGDLVFKQGDPGSSCYIILQGQVCLLRSDLNSTDEIDAHAGKSSHRKVMEKESSKVKCWTILARLQESENLPTTIVEEEPNEVDSNDPDATLAVEERKPEIKPPTNLGGQVAILGEGIIFGEMGLMTDHSRNASAWCCTDCDFLCIEKSAFDRVLKKNSGQLALPTLVAPLIKRVPFFCEHLRPSLLESVPYMVRYSHESRGTVLFWEDDPPGSCYLIVSGEVTIWKRKSDAPTAPEDMEAVTADLDVCKVCNDITPKLHNFQPTSSTHTSSPQLSRKTSNLRRSTVSLSSMEDLFGRQVLHLGTGMIFGEQALINDAPRSATISCRTDCHLLTIGRSVFDNMLREDMIKAKVKALGSTVRRLLKEFEMFSELTPAVLEGVPAIVRYVAKPRGTVLFEEGDPPGDCFILLSGEITIWVENKNLRRDSIFGKRASIRASIGRIQPELGEELLSLGASMTSTAALRGRPTCLDSSGEMHKPRPPLSQASDAAREKCSALASMFRNTIPKKRVDADGHEEDDADDSVIEDTCDPIVSLGPGSMFGELALLNENPRSATVSCRYDCELLVIERNDFDRVIKEEMKRSKDEKLDYLRTYLPGVKKLQAKEAERLLYYFNKVAFPRHHTFVEQGKIMDGSIYCLWQGSVELYCEEEDHHTLNPNPENRFRRLGILLKGSVFGALPQSAYSPYTIIATSSPCEVLHLAPDGHKHLPNSIVYSLREHLDMTVARRREQCAPLSPMGSFLPPATPSRPQTGASRAGTSLPRPRSGKLPRPLSGKLPSCCRPSTHSAGKRPDVISKLGSRSSAVSSMPSFRGVFQRWCSTVDYEEFDMDPGEVIALTARKPLKRNRTRDLAAGMQGSSSLPSLL